jgi:hypothetical protein
MSRHAPTAGLLLILMGLGASAYSQTSLRFEDIAGRWSGFTSPDNHEVALEIDPSGKFMATSALGSDRGEARLEDGRIILPLSEHQGTIQLTLEGDTLKGSGDVKGKTGTVSLKRAARGW